MGGSALDGSEELAEQLRAVVGRLVRSTRRVDLIPAAEAAVLGELDRGGELSTAHLAQSRRVRHQSMSKIVARLQAAGLLARSAHPTDRRTVLLSITEAGRAELAAERSHRADWLASAIDAELEPRERAVVAESIALLGRVADHARIP